MKYILHISIAFLFLLVGQSAQSQCDAEFTWEQLPGTLTIHFNNTSTSPNDITSNVWLFGDGQEGDGQHPNHTYAQPGTYNVCLIITDNEGCVADVCHNVVVQPAGSSCEAAFEWTISGLVVNFIDQSDNSPGIVSWHWDFGDGHTSTAQNPEHTYTEPGIYLVCLIIENELGCESDVCHEVVVEGSGDCEAAFEWVQGSGLVVQFFDQSDNNPDIVSWNWTFGDGGISDDPDPVHTYEEPGVYLVCLIIENEFGCTSDVCHEVVVEGSGGGDCEAAFEWEQGNNLVIHFIDQSDNDPDIVEWLWNFGDGTFGEAQNPVHEYDEPGVYLVCLIVTNEFGCVADVCHEVVVEGGGSGECEAAFEWEQGDNLVIHFIDHSDDDPDIVSWVWNFGDGHTGDGQNPVHEYDEPGVYLVCLIVTNEFGCVADVCHEVVVEGNGGGECEAAFEWEQGNNLVIHFIDHSDDDPDIVSWVWNFGDGHTGDGQNPVHEYDEPGIYLVCLIVTNEFGCVADVCHEVVVEEGGSGECEAAFEWEQGDNLVIHFIDQSDDDPDIVSWVWNFGDGHTGDGQNPVHEYDEPGVYLVCLIVTNEFGCVADVCHEVVVEEEECAALFTFSYSENGDVVEFDNNSTGGSEHTVWHWDFGDGHTSSEENPDHNYEEPGIYTVCLTMTDSVTGCYDDICIDLVYEMGYAESNSNSNIQSFRTSHENHSSLGEDIIIVRYTNPVSQNVNISYYIDKPTFVSLYLTNMTGDLVLSKNFGKSIKGNHEQEVYLGNIPAGLYTMRINMDDKVVTRLLTVTQ